MERDCISITISIQLVKMEREEVTTKGRSRRDAGLRHRNGAESVVLTEEDDESTFLAMRRLLCRSLMVVQEEISIILRCLCPRSQPGYIPGFPPVEDQGYRSHLQQYTTKQKHVWVEGIDQVTACCKNNLSLTQTV
jgi:hypothetical protein